MTQTLIDCSFSDACASIEGYVCDLDDETWSDYLDDMGMRCQMIDAIAVAPCSKVGVIKNLNVEAVFRNEGHGTRLLADLLETFDWHGAEIMILFADMEEANEISLTEWYEGFDFVRVDRDEAAPCMMIATEDLIATIRDINGYEPEAQMPSLR